MLQNSKILFQKFTPKNLNTPYAHGPQGLWPAARRVPFWSGRTVEPAARRRGRKAAASRRRTACRVLLPLSSVSMSIPPFRFYPGRRELYRNRAGAGRNKKRPHRLGLSRRSRRRCSMVHEEKVGRRPYGQLARRGPFHCGSAEPRSRRPTRTPCAATSERFPSVAPARQSGRRRALALAHGRAEHRVPAPL